MQFKKPRHVGIHLISKDFPPSYIVGNVLIKNLISLLLVMVLSTVIDINFSYVFMHASNFRSISSPFMGNYITKLDDSLVYDPITIDKVACGNHVIELLIRGSPNVSC